jgi:subtilase family serine protease
MDKTLITTAGIAMGLLGFGASAQPPSPSTSTIGAQQQTTMPGTQIGHFFKPASSKTQGPGRFHTNYVLRSVDGGKPAGMANPNDEANFSPDGSITLAETPCSLGSLYVGSPTGTPCQPSFNAKGGPSAKGQGAIALVDAYDNPNAASDLAEFSAHFGLPAANFVKVLANGNGSCKTPPADAGWALEESLDIEWAHVFAPNAAIILVEACSNSTADLVYAEKVAFEYIVKNHPDGGQVSNSWSGGEFSGQIADDAAFADFTYAGATGWKTHIVALASAGDSGEGPGWPSTNPWVISAGGTTVLRDSSTHAVTSEACWAGSGGGISTIESYTNSFTGGNMGPWANYQYPIYGQGNRATPDLSFDADPASGVYMLSQYNGGWFIVGGTSVSSPALAGILNRSDNKLATVSLNAVTGKNAYFTNAENNVLYAQLAERNDRQIHFYDVTTGSNGAAAVSGYDLCTGVGTPRDSHDK